MNNENPGSFLLSRRRTNKDGQHSEAYVGRLSLEPKATADCVVFVHLDEMIVSKRG